MPKAYYWSDPSKPNWGDRMNWTILDKLGHPPTWAHPLEAELVMMGSILEHIPLSVAPDRGVAATLAARADAELRWCGEDGAVANPAPHHLVKPEYLARAKEILPADAYRRECLGLSA